MIYNEGSSRSFSRRPVQVQTLVFLHSLSQFLLARRVFSGVPFGLYYSLWSEVTCILRLERATIFVEYPAIETE